jgi:hypothetical protein
MIIQNEAQCAKCKAIVFSAHRHDYKSCECGAIAVDGGMAYLKRVGKPDDIIERSMILDEKIIIECTKAAQWGIDTGRNAYGIALAVIRALRDNDCLNLEKFGGTDGSND